MRQPPTICTGAGTSHHILHCSTHLDLGLQVFAVLDGIVNLRQHYGHAVRVVAVETFKVHQAVLVDLNGHTKGSKPEVCPSSSARQGPHSTDEAGAEKRRCMVHSFPPQQHQWEK